MDETAVQRRKQGWLAPIALLLLLTAVPLIPPLRVLLPVEHGLLLLSPALAVCAVLGWWTGGRWGLAIVWSLLAIWILLLPDRTTTEHFDNLQRGWALLLAASFGLVSLVAHNQTFVPRALASLIVALGLGAGVLLASGASWPALTEEVAAELVARSQEFADAYQTQVRGSGFAQDLAEKNPSVANMAEQSLAQLDQLAVRAGSVFPALLALQSLAVLALAWRLFHLLSRTSIGTPLPPFREFRFNDQLVWGLLLGVTLVVVPALGASMAGWTLIVFFGGLYAARGLAVVAWLLRQRRRWVKVAAVLLLIIVPAYALAAMMGLGVGDTWADWRRARPAV